MNDYVPTDYQKKAFRAVEEDGEYVLGPTSHPYPKNFLDKAFQYSIAKWTIICELLDQDINLVRCGEDTTCALCKLAGAGCVGCPIYIYIGTKGCKGTPYMNFLPGDDIPDRLSVARKEVVFLQKVYRWWMMRGQ